MGKQMLAVVGGVVDHVAGPVKMDWKKLLVADPIEDDIGFEHMHLLAGVLDADGAPMVIKCKDPDCDVDGILVDEVDGVNHN